MQARAGGWRRCKRPALSDLHRPVHIEPRLTGARAPGARRAHTLEHERSRRSSPAPRKPASCVTRPTCSATTSRPFAARCRARLLTARRQASSSTTWKSTSTAFTTSKRRPRSKRSSAMSASTIVSRPHRRTGAQRSSRRGRDLDTDQLDAPSAAGRTRSSGLRPSRRPVRPAVPAARRSAPARGSRSRRRCSGSARAVGSPSARSCSHRRSDPRRSPARSGSSRAPRIVGALGPRARTPAAY